MELTEKKCLPCEGGVEPLTKEQSNNLLKQINGWSLNETGTEIKKEFKLKSYYKTIAFVNAVAWIAQEEGHHPDIEVGYDHCLIRYSTHAIGGLSQNDFICAAKIDQLIGSGRINQN